MGKIMFRLAGVLFISIVLGCATADTQETSVTSREERIAAPEIVSGSEAMDGNAVSPLPEASDTSKTRLIFDVSSCSWSYIDEEGTLQAVSIRDGKPQYVSRGKVRSIDLSKTKIVFQ